MAQAAYYRDIKSGIVWAGSLRTGLLVPTLGNEIPLSQKFFTGGGSTLSRLPTEMARARRSRSPPAAIRRYFLVLPDRVPRRSAIADCQPSSDYPPDKKGLVS